MDPTLNLGPNGEPRIASVQLDGIPDQNIQVDQSTRQIIATVPTNFSAVVAKTRFQLTPDTYITSSHSDSLYIYPFIENDTVKLSTTAQKTNTYHFVFKSINELKFAYIANPLVFTVHPQNSHLCIPVYDFTDSDARGTLTLTNRQSGQQIRQQQYLSTYAAGCSSENRTDGAVFTNIYINGRDLYEPGEYTVEFTKLNGRRATLNQPVRIERGETELYFFQDNPIVIGDTTLTTNVYAANLFPADKPSLLFRGRNQTPFVVQPAKFLSTSGFELPVLRAIQPGYYYAQLLTNGKPTTNFVRIPVISAPNDLVIQYLYEPYAQNTNNLLDPSKPLTTPIVLNRNKYYTLTTNAFTAYLYKVKAGDTAFSRVRLTSITTPDSVYLVPITENSSVSGNLKFLSDIPPGRYQFTFEILTNDKTILSSEPLERDILIE